MSAQRWAIRAAETFRRTPRLAAGDRRPCEVCGAPAASAYAGRGRPSKRCLVHERPDARRRRLAAEAAARDAATMPRAA